MDKSKWEYKKWENVLDIINGRDYKSVVDPNGIYPICGSGGIMGHANSYLCPENSVIIGRKGNINHPIFMNEKYWNVDTAFGLVAKEGILLPKFLFYFCDWYDFEKHNKAVTIPSLTKRDLLKIQIQIPSITDQQRIVSELDQLNELISLKQEQLKEYDALAQSLFYEMFLNTNNSWPLKTIGELSSDVKYGTSKAGGIEGKYKYLRMNNLTDDGHLDLRDLKYIDLSENELEKYVVRRGDILFNRTNSREKVGKTALYWEDENMVIAGYIIRVRLRESVDPIYFVKYMNTPYMKKVLRKLAKGAVGQANINAQQMQSIQVPLPPLSLQHSFATKIRAIEAQKDLLKQSIGELQTLLASRMQEYFA